MLRAASVFGATFWKGGVVALLGSPTSPVAARAGDWLAELSAREVIEPRGEQRFPGEEAFAFRHALMREAAYATLSRGRSRRPPTGSPPPGSPRPARTTRSSWPITSSGAATPPMRSGTTAAPPSRRSRATTSPAPHRPRRAGRRLRRHRRGAGRAARARGRRRTPGAARWRAPSSASTEAMDLLPLGSALWCQSAGVAVAVAPPARPPRPVHGAGADALHRGAHPRRRRSLRHGLGAGDRLPPHRRGLYGFARAYMARVRAVVGAALAMSPVARGWVGWAECVLVKYETGDSQRHLRLADEAIACFAEAGDVRGALRIRMERGVALRQLGGFAEAEAELVESLGASPSASGSASSRPARSSSSAPCASPSGASRRPWPRRTGRRRSTARWAT